MRYYLLSRTFDSELTPNVYCLYCYKRQHFFCHRFNVFCLFLKTTFLYKLLSIYEILPHAIYYCDEIMTFFNVFQSVILSRCHLNSLYQISVSEHLFVNMLEIDSTMNLNLQLRQLKTHFFP